MNGEEVMAGADPILLLAAALAGLAALAAIAGLVVARASTRRNAATVEKRISALDARFSALAELLAVAVQGRDDEQGEELRALRHAMKDDFGMVFANFGVLEKAMRAESERLEAALSASPEEEEAREAEREAARAEALDARLDLLRETLEAAAAARDRALREMLDAAAGRQEEVAEHAAAMLREALAGRETRLQEAIDAALGGGSGGGAGGAQTARLAAMERELERLAGAAAAPAAGLGGRLVDLDAGA